MRGVAGSDGVHSACLLVIDAHSPRTALAIAGNSAVVHARIDSLFLSVETHSTRRELFLERCGRHDLVG